MNCKHENFSADVKVNRLTDSGSFLAEIRIKCMDCGLPFEFPDIAAGISGQRIMASPDAQELRVPLKPKGSLIFPAIPGFSVRAQ